MKRPRKTPPSTGDECSPTFEEDYLDIDHWPTAWRVEPDDLARGKVMADLFKVFLTHQLQLARSRKTLRVHGNNLHALGGQMIRIWHESRTCESAASFECYSKPSVMTAAPSSTRL